VTLIRSADRLGLIVLARTRYYSLSTPSFGVLQEANQNYQKFVFGIPKSQRVEAVFSVPWSVTIVIEFT
jgi:hypothetical protein